jgi:hypothetical protein
MRATTDLGVAITYTRQGEINDLSVKARWDVDFGTALTNPQMAASRCSYATDGNLLADPADAPRTFPGYDDIMQYEPILRQGPDAFEAAIAEDAPTPIPEEKVYGLLALERNGQNRTPYVQAAMKRLGLKVSELPGGGPGYTNDVRPLSELKDHA